MILDLFAGPGGWSEGLAEGYGLTDLGLEHDRDTCATRAAAGHRTIRTDVAAYPPERFTGKVTGLIASPPCQAFSVAGKGKGTHEARTIREHVIACTAGWEPLGHQFADPRAGLVLEPLRWVDEIRPRWVALEQVPAVLPLWRAYDVVLGGWGYSVWSGELNAADYGVPQTRKRAILIASLDRRVTAPRPTHTRGGSSTRLGWVSMAAALGWDDAYAGATVGFRRVDDLGTSPTGYLERDERPIDEPAFALTEKARSWTLTRPATTICGDARVFSPGGHKANDGRDNSKMVGRSEDAIRIEPADALVLQSFPADYPVRGTRSAQFRQIGDAMPPLLAEAVLGEVL